MNPPLEDRGVRTFQLDCASCGARVIVTCAWPYNTQDALPTGWLAVQRKKHKLPELFYCMECFTRSADAHQ